MKTKLIAPDYVYRKVKQIQSLFEDREWGSKATLLDISLMAAVPLYQVQILEREGPTDTDFEFCNQFAWDLGAYGDRLLFRESKPKQGPSTAAMFNGLAKCVAIASMVPGGIQVLGRRYVMDEESQERADVIDYLAKCKAQRESQSVRRKLRRKLRKR